MATAYPSALDTTGGNLKNTWANADVTDTVHPAAHNNVADAIIAIETELGVDPSGTFVDIATRQNARLTCRKTADQAFASTTLANVTDMSFPVSASLDYMFEFIVPFAPSTLTSGLALAVACPASPSYIVYSAEYFVVTSAANIQGVATASGSKIQGPTSTAAAVVYKARVKGILSNGANAGTLQLQASEGGGTAASQTIKKGAYGELYVN